MINTTYENNTINKYVESSMTADTFNTNREYLLDKQEVIELNTYRNWGDFSMRILPWEKGHEEPNKDPKTKDNMPTIWVPDKKGNRNKKYFIGAKSGVFGDLELDDINGAAGEMGTKSLFNNTHEIWENTTFRIVNNAPLIDGPEMREKMRERNDCSIKSLVEKSRQGRLGRAIYHYSDFMYCKHLGKISNNYLITLRRFSLPCSDYIMIMDPDNENAKALQEHAPAVGTMVTWMGTPGNELENILKYSVKMPFQERTAKVEPVGGDEGRSGGLNALMSSMSSTYASQCLAGTHGTAVSTLPFMGDLSSPPYAGLLGHMDSNRVYGPVDVVKKTHIRGEDGLDYSHEISLVFDYELRSYDGINGKSAMLDLLGNILATCYSTGTWWGGARRGTGAGQTKAFTNLPLWKLGTGKYPMTFAGVTDCLMDTCTSVAETFAKNNPSGDGSIMGAIKGVLSNLASMFGGAMLNKLGRPQKQGMNSLLTPEPSGFWHLTIGNPNCPIMSMGNLIMDSCEIQHYGPLGIDDFPTGIKVSVKLKPGKSRDIAEIEEMYTWGDNRIYTPMSEGIEEMYKKSKIYKWKTGNTSSTQRSNLSDTISPALSAQAAMTAANAIQNSENKSNGEDSIKDSIKASAEQRQPDKLENFNGFNWAMRFFGVEGDRKRLIQSAMEQDQGSPKTNGQAEKPKAQKAAK